ncbi:MAG: protoheme IX farnesyltransferase, partial [Ktedonobacterales bacterium]|nr:protoheme IX farnesyltransferase [Ktedonobacterales bacterium]
MSISTASYVAARATSWQRAQDYLELTKPKIVLMELVTVAVAGVVASGGAPNVWLVLHALLGTVLVGAGASAWNQWLERHSDALMPRTAERPLPGGRLGSREVVLLGSLASLSGVIYLGLLTNVLTAALGAATWVLYVGVYTPLKARSPFNTVVGAVAGALPILMGWTAVGGRLGLSAATLFLIVFLWQFPHFMAIAWIYRRQYAAAGLKMLSVVDPSGVRAGAQAVWGALALVPVSLLPALISSAGPTYFVWALTLGVGQLVCATLFWLKMNDHSARVLLRASLVYLPALLMWLLIGPFRSS